MGIVPVLLCYATASSQKLVFSYYTIDQGLSQNMVDCILKDSRGFMWFGTWNGLNRFDGYDFVVYKGNALDTNSLSDNFVHVLCEDHFGNIWIGCEKGLNVYIFSENRFINYSSEISNALSTNINVIIRDKEDNIWIGTDEGLEIIKPINSQGVFERYSQSYPTSKIYGINILDLCEDNNGNIWIGTASGLFYYNHMDNQIERVLSGSGFPDDLFSNQVNAVYIDHEGSLWVGLEMVGLVRFSLSNKIPYLYSNNPDISSSIIHNSIQSISEDILGNILIGTLGGLCIYNKKDDNFVNYMYKLNNKNSLNNEFVNCIMADDDGNIWIGTERGGVNQCNIYQKKFESFENEPGNPNSLSHNKVNSIYEDEKYIWIGTAGGGLNRYEKSTGSFKIYQNNPHRATTLNNNYITAICKNRTGILWIGAWGGGVHKLSPVNEEKGFFIKYTDESPGGLINSYVSSIIEDRFGKLWIGTLGGIDIYDRSSDKFLHIVDYRLNNILNEVGCLQFDSEGNLWVGTEHGLYKIMAGTNGEIDPLDPIVKFYYSIPRNLNSLSGDYIISILFDSNDTLWFGTYGNGLNKLIGEDKNGQLIFKRYTETDGLSNNTIYGILEDNHGNIWMSTDNGLSKYNKTYNTFKNYYKSDGLLNNQYYWSACYKNKEGKMYFGGMKGLNMFHPDSIIDNEIPPRAILTNLKINNQPVEVGKIYNRNKVLTNSISDSKSITLSYKSTEFTIEFSALHYDQPKKNRYKYILHGFDKQWNEVDSRRRYATYSNLDGGEYLFQVFASNNDGKWSENPVELIVNIIPPFWKTWWFRILVAFLLSASTFIYIRLRLYSLKVNKIKLEQKVAQRTAQIEKQKEELQAMAKILLDTNTQLEINNEQIEKQKRQVEKQNEEILAQRDKLIEMNKKVKAANQHRIHFFNNISHEFRTPLTLILSPLEQLVERLDISFNIKQKLMLMHKNARRLLNLINQLMELRKVETGKIDLKASKDNIVKVITNISQSFQELSFVRNLSFMVSANPNSIQIYFDHEKIENIVYNLLSNAFKYTPEGGIVTIDVTRIKKDNSYSNYVPIVERSSGKQLSTEDFAEIKVTDTGIGIDSNHMRDIFRMFYRDPSIEGTNVRGTGIGLSLVKELVKAHRGSLYVKSEKGKGSTFCVLIPFDDKYLMPEEKVETIDVLTSSYKSGVIKPKIPIREHRNNGETDSTRYILPLVLVVEDNPDMRTYLAEQLQNSFRLIEATNGKEAIELAINHSPDIIISDIMMPEMDGLELCAQIKEELQTSHIPVILLTAKVAIKNLIEGLETGADDYISKPFNIEVLKAKVRNLIENRKKLKKKFSTEITIDASVITTTSADEKFLKKAIEVVEENYSNCDFGVEEFVGKMYVSRSLLHKKLCAITDQSAGNFITSIRLKKSVQLIYGRSHNISQIAYEVGYNDPKYFSRIFKKHYGKTPSEYMKDLMVAS